ncbi:MAG: shikimate kinase AroK [Pseudomonadales bacterium]|nr:shikimate kinase AroK [Pseudomonadales bacterium]
MTTRNVYLVGMMAVGKTTVGRHLASRLDFTFHDTDQVIESRAGADISWIFELEGEERFRDREQQVIEEMTQSERVVLATGGGAVLREANRNLLRDRGIVVYLRSGVDLIIERTRSDRRRPLLQVDDVRERIETLTTERGPLYESVAHLAITVDRRPPKAIATDIHHLLEGLDDRSDTETATEVDRCGP